jgi:excisionase family DNA binding protein
MESSGDRGALSVSEAAAYAAISRAFLYRLMGTGAIKSLHIGRRRLILKADLDKFLEERLAEAVGGR